MLITALLSVFSVFYGIKYNQVKNALKEIVDATEDDTVTKEEFIKIVLAIKRLLY